MTNFLTQKQVLKAIDDEPELPGEIPDQMYQTIVNSDKDTVEVMLRFIVKETKRGIKERILNGVV